MKKILKPVLTVTFRKILACFGASISEASATHLIMPRSILSGTAAWLAVRRAAVSAFCVHCVFRLKLKESTR